MVFAVKSVMGHRLLPAGLAAAMLALGCPCAAWSQNTSQTNSYSSGINVGANGLLPPPSQGGTDAALSATVDATAVANSQLPTQLPSTQGGSLSDTSDSGQLSASPGASGSARSGTSLAITSAGFESQTSQPNWGVGKGWGVPSAAFGMSAPSGAGSLSLGHKTQGAVNPSHSLSNVPAEMTKLRGSGHGSLTIAAGHGSSKPPTGSGLKTLASMSSGSVPGKSNSDKEGDEDSEVGGGAGGGGTYTSDFPDSTKNTAVISPPDLGATPLFSFEPKVGEDFPDLTQREFLKPSLDVRGTSATGQNDEDPYERIERRLNEYRARMYKAQGMKTGSKQDKLSGAALSDPLARRKLENGLTKDALSSGLKP